MGMQVLNLEQGSDEWKEIRGKYCVASEAPVIMGASTKVRRDELLHMKSTGVEREISDYVERFIFPKGHEVEAKARPIAEHRLDDDLFALTCVNTVSGLELLASYDGITAPLSYMHWEHKQFNAELFEIVSSGGELKGEHFWQLEHQMLVNGNSECTFACSDGTEERYAEMVYVSRPERREQLIEGWKLFMEDLANFVPQAEEVEAVGDTIKDLPTLRVEIDGAVKSSNLAVYKANALDFLKQINTNLETDEDFAAAENTVKFLGEKEKELEQVEKRTLGQVASIDELIRTIAQLKDSMRDKRLLLDKLVKAEKKNRKTEIIQSAKKALVEYIKEIDNDLAIVHLPEIQADFVAATKNKRTITTLRSATNDELARAKIEANRIANIVRSNLEVYRTVANDKVFLFADLQELIVRDSDAFEAIVKQRIADHEEELQKKKQAEEARLESERLEKERQANLQQGQSDDIEELMGALTGKTISESPVKSLSPVYETAPNTQSIPEAKSEHENFDAIEMAYQDGFIEGLQKGYEAAKQGLSLEDLIKQRFLSNQGKTRRTA